MSDSEAFVQQLHCATTPSTARPLASAAQTELGCLPVTRIDRLVIKVLSGVAHHFVGDITGLENIAEERDPFILVANHSSRREVLILPPLLFAFRGGQRIHFVADWNFQLIPGVGWLYRRAGVITTTRKSARPRFLNILKPLFTEDGTALERAKAHLQCGRSVAIFPEGTINRDPGRLLFGRRGAAQLSLETGVPIVPVGIRLNSGADGDEARGRVLMNIRIGDPLDPMTAIDDAASSGVRDWHALVMRRIEHLSGKAWNAKRGDQP